MKRILSVFIAAFLVVGGISHHKKDPKMMLERFQEAAEASGDISDYLSDEGKALFSTVDKSGSFFSEIGILSDKQVTDIIIKKISEIDWKLKDVDIKKNKGKAVFEFEYDGIVDISGTVEFSLKKVKTDKKFPKSLFDNEWRIDGISDVNL